MRLYVLAPIEDDNGPTLAIEKYGFSPYGDCYEVAVLAEDETSARQMASVDEFSRTALQMWLDPEVTSCREVDISVAGVVLRAEGTG